MPDTRTAIRIRTLGRTAYEPTWRAMQAFTDTRDVATPDEIWLTEHPPVYTLGLAGRRAHLLRENGIPLIHVDRGGQITYHGPGQLVVYLLFDLRRHRLGVRAMVRSIEEAVVIWLDTLGIPGHGKQAAPGIYVQIAAAGEAKIAAMGLRVRKGCTYHGLSINLEMDLQPFNDIDPCGFPGLVVTEVAAFRPSPSIADAGASLAPILAARITRAAP